MSRDFDFIVIGATIGGLSAAAYLARGGARVLVVEKALAPPEPPGALFALDPVMVAELKLAQHGLSFMSHDLALTGWDDDEPPLTLPRDRRAAQRAIGARSQADAEAWGLFQKELAAHANVLHRWWSRPAGEGRAEDMFWRPSARDHFARLSLMGAADWLARYFEHRQVLGTLLSDALAGGFAPSEPGSALSLVWRAAQEMNGLKATCALAVPGTLVAALRRSCGAVIETGMAATQIMVSRGQAGGLQMEDGAMVSARAVLSSLSRNATEKLAGLDRPLDGSQVGTVRIVLSLNEGMALPAVLKSGRCVVALGPADLADAHENARAGRLPVLAPCEVVAETPRRLVVTQPFMPLNPEGGWPALQAPVAAQIVKHLSRHIPGLGEGLNGVAVTPPVPRPRASLAKLLAPAHARAITRVPGLYLCGADAEPVSSVSGRAGRFAAHFALAAR